MCIIAVESELYRIFALLLCQLLPKSVFFSQRWLWLGAQHVAEISLVVWPGRREPELARALLVGMVGLTLKITRNYHFPQHRHRGRDL